MTYEYNDGLRPVGRAPRLYLAKGGEIKKFVGASIDGFCAIATQKYEKNGKWSNTTYLLNLAPGVRAIYLLSPMHGKWGDNLGSWGEVTEALGLPVDVAQSLIRSEYKATAERLDKLEEFALAVEATGLETETVVISFGSPTNRSINEGYWEKPKSTHTSDGRTTVIVKPRNGDWSNPEIVEPSDAKIISSRHQSGMHGGYWTVEVAVPIAN